MSDWTLVGYFRTLSCCRCWGMAARSVRVLSVNTDAVCMLLPVLKLEFPVVAVKAMGYRA